MNILYIHNNIPKKWVGTEDKITICINYKNIIKLLHNIKYDILDINLDIMLEDAAAASDILRFIILEQIPIKQIYIKTKNIELYKDIIRTIKNIEVILYN